MHTDEKTNKPKCSCTKSNGSQFVEIVSIKNSDVVIYRDTTRSKRDVEIDLREPDDYAIILSNKSDAPVAPKDFIATLESALIDCPQCRKNLHNAKKMIEKLQTIEKNIVVGVCNHCMKKSHVIKSCHGGISSIKKFLNLAIESNKKSDIKPNKDKNLRLNIDTGLSLNLKAKRDHKSFKSIEKISSSVVISDFSVIDLSYIKPRGHKVWEEVIGDRRTHPKLETTRRKSDSNLVDFSIKQLSLENLYKTRSNEFYFPKRFESQDYRPQISSSELIQKTREVLTKQKRDKLEEKQRLTGIAQDATDIRKSRDDRDYAEKISQSNDNGITDKDNLHLDVYENKKRYIDMNGREEGDDQNLKPGLAKVNKDEIQSSRLKRTRSDSEDDDNQPSHQSTKNIQRSRKNKSQLDDEDYYYDDDSARNQTSRKKRSRSDDEDYDYDDDKARNLQGRPEMKKNKASKDDDEILSKKRRPKRGSFVYGNEDVKTSARVAKINKMHVSNKQDIKDDNIKLGINKIATPKKAGKTNNVSVQNLTGTKRPTELTKGHVKDETVNIRKKRPSGFNVGNNVTEEKKGFGVTASKDITKSTKKKENYDDIQSDRKQIAAAKKLDNNADISLQMSPGTKKQTELTKGLIKNDNFNVRNQGSERITMEDDMTEGKKSFVVGAKKDPIKRSKIKENEDEITKLDKKLITAAKKTDYKTDVSLQNSPGAIKQLQLKQGLVKDETVNVRRKGPERLSVDDDMREGKKSFAGAANKDRTQDSKNEDDIIKLDKNHIAAVKKTDKKNEVLQQLPVTKKPAELNKGLVKSEHVDIKKKRQERFSIDDSENMNVGKNNFDLANKGKNQSKQNEGDTVKLDKKQVILAKKVDDFYDLKLPSVKIEMKQDTIMSEAILEKMALKENHLGQCLQCFESDSTPNSTNVHKISTKNVDVIVEDHILKQNKLPRDLIKDDTPPIVFQNTFVDSNQELTNNIQPTLELRNKDLFADNKNPRKTIKKYTDQNEYVKGGIRYALSDKSFIEKGWTLLPVEKIVRKMNVYRMHPAHPEFDWFAHNKTKGVMTYDTGEKLAEFDDNGRGRWYYKNGSLALDYYDCEELHANQRVVIYSSGEADENGRKYPITVLATFDYVGNGVVFDHTGKIRLKYNQTEGVILDRSLGPVSNWKWHSLNDPPVLQQVMIDTHAPRKDPEILKMGTDKRKQLAANENEDMLAIEFENIIKERNKKLTQNFQAYQIKMKALKMNENFSLRILDQATVHLLFRDGKTSLKLNLGMVLDHHDILETRTSEVGVVEVPAERLPAGTASLAELQAHVEGAQRAERARREHALRVRMPPARASGDNLTRALWRPPPAPAHGPAPTACGATLSDLSCPYRYRKPSSTDMYYSNSIV